MIFLVLLVTFLKLTESAKVIIIGSGLSGYATAAKLLENNINDIIILEAENRMGGRIHTIPFGDNKFIDLGAQWVHGQKGNVIYELVSKYYKFGSSKFDDRDSICRISSGFNSDSETVQNQTERLLELTEKLLDDSYDEMVKFHGSLGDFFITSYKKQMLSSEYSDIPDELKNLVLEFAPKLVNAFYGSPSWFDISQKLEMKSGETKGDQDLTWRTDGYKTVFEFINRKRPGTMSYLDVDSKILLNKEVINIQWNPNARNDKITITCADDSKFEADHVVFTASLGVLKDRHEKLFTPNLPAEKVNSITHTGFGTLDKIFLEFAEPFWPYGDKDFSGYVFLWNKSDLDTIKNTEMEWVVDIPGFDRVDAFPYLIEIFYAGENVETFEKISDDKLVSDVMWVLEKFLSKKLAAPTRMIRTRWQSNKNFLGSYSFNSVDAEKNLASAEILRQPLKDASGKPKILFAGEATHLKYSSYAHGAVASGWDAGKYLADNL